MHSIYDAESSDIKSCEYKDRRPQLLAVGQYFVRRENAGCVRLRSQTTVPVIQIDR